MRYNLLRHLERSIFLNDKRPHYMAIFTAYFDASVNKNKAVTTVAGFVSRVNKWERFEEEWKRLLPSTVKLFHMTDFVSSKCGWESWKGPDNSNRRRELIDGLVSCIVKSTNKGFSQTLRQREYDGCDEEYKLSEHYGTPYTILGIGCLGRLDVWAKKKKIDRQNILCIFEHGDEGQGHFINMARNEGFNAITQSKADIRAFDACDLSAWKSRTLIDDSYERELQLQDPIAAHRIMNSLAQIERVTTDPAQVGQYSAAGLRRLCEHIGIERR